MADGRSVEKSFYVVWLQMTRCIEVRGKPGLHWSEAEALVKKKISRHEVNTLSQGPDEILTITEESVDGFDRRIKGPSELEEKKRIRAEVSWTGADPTPRSLTEE